MSTPKLLMLTLLPLLSGCGSYYVATFPFVSTHRVNEKELCSGCLQTDATPIQCQYVMPETNENKERPVSFAHILESDDLQILIESSIAAQGSDCVGLKDTQIIYEWLSIPFLFYSYRYTLEGTPVRK